jgi:hypothetical protein
MLCRSNIPFIVHDRKKRYADYAGPDTISELQAEDNMPSPGIRSCDADGQVAHQQESTIGEGGGGEQVRESDNGKSAQQSANVFSEVGHDHARASDVDKAMHIGKGEQANEGYGDKFGVHNIYETGGEGDDDGGPMLLD